MDDEQLKRTAWAGMVEFQRLLGAHAPAGGLKATDHFVASSVPGLPSSLMNAATPIGHEALGPHLDEIERFYASTPKWGVWVDPGAAADVAALAGRGLVLDSSPVLMAAELDVIAAGNGSPVERVDTIGGGDLSPVERADTIGERDLSQDERADTIGERAGSRVERVDTIGDGPQIERVDTIGGGSQVERVRGHAPQSNHEDVIEQRNDALVERVELRDVGAVNDAAYGYPKPVLAPTLASLPADGLHAHGIRIDQELASVALVIDTNDDAFVTMVATLPHQRGKRLASNLLAHALTEASRRGRHTTSLQASKLGQGIYARLGYRALGEAHLYEKRPA